MNKLIDRLQVRQERLANTEDGFSLLELVVAVSIMLILAVVGFIAYQGLTDNARDAALSSAVNQVATATIAEANTPGDSEEAIIELAEDFNDSSNGITVGLAGQEDRLVVVAWEDDNLDRYTNITVPGNYSNLGTAGGNIRSGMMP